MKRILPGFSIVFLLYAGTTLSYAQNIISTVAGNGSIGYSGDGNTATYATLDNPEGVAVDAAGNVYIADVYNNCIRKLTISTGIITTVAGNGTPGYSGDGGPATTAQLSGPVSVALDKAGNMYIGDIESHRIRKVMLATGIITTIAGNGIAGYSGDGGAATAAKTDRPFGVAVDAYNNVYFADSYNQRIRRVDANTGIISTIGGSGNQGYWGDGQIATSAALYYPTAIALDKVGNVYFVDEYNYCIRKITMGSGIISTIAGNTIDSYSGDGGPATACEFSYPDGVAVDAAGNVYIGDVDNNRVRKVDAATGIINTIAGTGIQSYSGDGGAATAADLYNPYGVAVDASGNVYIADRYNNRIRKINGSTSAISEPDHTTEDAINIYPNPSRSGIVHLDITAPIEYIEVYNMLGQMVLKSAASKILDLSSLNKGVYTFVLHEKQSSTARKVVLE